MVDTTITALSSATTPLAGTEVLPTDQSGVTVKVTATSIAQAPLTYVSKNSTYAIQTTDSIIEFPSGTFTATLPTAIGVQGKVYRLKNTGTGVVTIATTSSQTIDGSLTKGMTQNQSVTLMSNNSNWIILSDSVPTPYKDISTTYQILAGDYYIDCNSGSFTVTMPDATLIPTGRRFFIKNTGTGVITINTLSSQTIDGALTLYLSVQYESFNIISDGSNWAIY